MLKIAHKFTTRFCFSLSLLILKSRVRSFPFPLCFTLWLNMIVSYFIDIRFLQDCRSLVCLLALETLIYAFIFHQPKSLIFF